MNIRSGGRKGWSGGTIGWNDSEILVTLIHINMVTVVTVSSVQVSMVTVHASAAWVVVPVPAQMTQRVEGIERRHRAHQNVNDDPRIFFVVAATDMISVCRSAHAHVQNGKADEPQIEDETQGGSAMVKVGGLDDHAH